MSLGQSLSPRPNHAPWDLGPQQPNMGPKGQAGAKTWTGTSKECQWCGEHGAVQRSLLKVPHQVGGAGAQNSGGSGEAGAVCGVWYQCYSVGAASHKGGRRVHNPKSGTNPLSPISILSADVMPLSMSLAALNARNRLHSGVQCRADWAVYSVVGTGF